MRLILFFVFSVGWFFSVSAQNKTLFPQAFFDKKQAQELLEYGNTSLEGVASALNASATMRYTAAEGTVIMLFPVTPYFEEWYKLRKKMERKKIQVLMSEEAFKYRIETLTDADGRFKFEKLKPGKYYLETIINFTSTGSYDQQTGTRTGLNGYGQPMYSAPVYETFFYNYADSRRKWKFVEIKKDGTALKIKL